MTEVREIATQVVLFSFALATVATLYDRLGSKIVPGLLSFEEAMRPHWLLRREPLRRQDLAGQTAPSLFPVGTFAVGAPLSRVTTPAVYELSKGELAVRRDTAMWGSIGFYSPKKLIFEIVFWLVGIASLGALQRWGPSQIPRVVIILMLLCGLGYAAFLFLFGWIPVVRAVSVFPLLPPVERVMPIAFAIWHWLAPLGFLSIAYEARGLYLDRPWTWMIPGLVWVLAIPPRLAYSRISMTSRLKLHGIGREAHPCSEDALLLGEVWTGQRLWEICAREQKRGAERTRRPTGRHALPYPDLPSCVTRFYAADTYLRPVLIAFGVPYMVFVSVVALALRVAFLPLRALERMRSAAGQRSILDTIAIVAALIGVGALVVLVVAPGGSP